MADTNQFPRSEILLGSDALLKFKNSRVAVFGVGGLGGYVVKPLPAAASELSI